MNRKKQRPSAENPLYVCPIFWTPKEKKRGYPDPPMDVPKFPKQRSLSETEEKRRQAKADKHAARCEALGISPITGKRIW